jgi:hypothetical protein
MSNPLDLSLLDVRTIERFIAEGKVTVEAYEAALAGLEDCAADADESRLVFTSHARSRRVDFGAEPTGDEDES